MISQYDKKVKDNVFHNQTLEKNIKIRKELLTQFWIVKFKFYFFADIWCNFSVFVTQMSKCVICKV